MGKAMCRGNIPNSTNMHVASGELDGGSIGDDSIFSRSAYPGLDNESDFCEEVNG